MTDSGSRIEVLSRVPAFAGLGREELLHLASLLHEIELRKGDVLCKEGEPGETLYLIERGELEVRATLEPERVLRRLGAGDVVGEIALLLGGTRTATVTAARPSRLLALAKEDFQRLFGANPAVIEYVSRILAQRMAASTRGAGLHRAYTSVAVFGRAGVRGKSLVASALAALLRAFSDGGVLLVELRRRTTSRADGLLDLTEAAEGPPSALRAASDAEPGGFERAVLALAESCDEARLAAAADAVAYKGRDAFPIVVFDLPEAPVVRGAAVAQFADVVVEVARQQPVPALPDGNGQVRHYVVLNRWHDDSPAPDVIHCEPFVLPVDLALCDRDAPTCARLVLEQPRTPASPPLRRLARKILGTSVGVALGGGAAFGIAHVGVFRAFERHGIPVDLVAGTSMGSIVALGYAAGLEPEAMRRIALRIGTKRTTLSALDFTLTRPGLLAGDRLVAIFGPLLGSVQRFDQLTFPCQTVATDIESGERVCLASGRLTDAFRASCSVPMLWSPVQRDGRTLVDGGMVDPVPVDVVREMGADFCIGVNVVPQLKRGVETAISRWYRRLNPVPRLGVGRDMPSTFDTVMNTIQVLQHELGKFKAISADVRIDPDLADFTWIEFYRPAEMIERGEEAAERAVPRIRELLAERLASRAAR